MFIPTVPLSNLPAQDPWAILDRASRTYDSIRTLSANFVQIVENPMLGAPDTTRGRLFQRRPNHFAMRFSDPAGDRIVADGRYLWLYTPSSTPGQVMRSAIPGTGTTGPNLIGQFVERPRERYDARYLSADSSTAGVADAIVLTPKRGIDLPYTAATIYVSRDDGLVRRVEIAETSGQRRTVVLRDATVNEQIPAAEFRFAPPGGSRVVDQ